jgi:hypothetical protein
VLLVVVAGIAATFLDLKSSDLQAQSAIEIATKRSAGELAQLLTLNS